MEYRWPNIPFWSNYGSWQNHLYSLQYELLLVRSIGTARVKDLHSYWPSNWRFYTLVWRESCKKCWLQFKLRFFADLLWCGCRVTLYFTHYFKYQTYCHLFSQTNAKLYSRTFFYSYINFLWLWFGQIFNWSCTKWELRICLLFLLEMWT